MVSQHAVTGKVYDLDSGEPLAFAQAALMAPADSSLITGSTTYVDGVFEIRTDVQGSHLLRLGFVGYTGIYMAIP